MSNKFLHLSEKQQKVIELFQKWAQNRKTEELQYNDIYYHVDGQFGSIKSLLDAACALFMLSYDERVKIYQIAEEEDYWLPV